MDAQGNVVEVWEKVDNIFGESVSFLPTDRTEFIDEGEDTTGNQTSGDARNVYELDTLTVNAVPLPAAVWLFGSAIGGLLVISRRRRA